MVRIKTAAMVSIVDMIVFNFALAFSLNFEIDINGVQPAGKRIVEILIFIK